MPVMGLVVTVSIDVYGADTEDKIHPAAMI